MMKLSRRMEQALANMPQAFLKFGDAFVDSFDRDDDDERSLEALLRGFSQHERRSLKTFLDEILGPDYSDEDLELIWSKIPSCDYFADRFFISSTRGLFQALRKELS